VKRLAVAFLAFALLAAPLVAGAQRKTVPTIGLLDPSSLNGAGARVSRVRASEARATPRAASCECSRRHPQKIVGSGLACREPSC
jgi:hypothetical protein